MSTVMSATEDTPLDRVKRMVLQKFDVADGKYEAVVELLEIGPNVVMDRHSHSGPETGYLLEGDATFEFDEQPALHVKAGQSYVLPTDFVHVAKSGPAGAKGIYMWVIEKGRPFRTWAETPAWRSPPEA